MKTITLRCGTVASEDGLDGIDMVDVTLDGEDINLIESAQASLKNGGFHKMERWDAAPHEFYSCEWAPKGGYDLTTRVRLTDELPRAVCNMSVYDDCVSFFFELNSGDGTYYTDRTWTVAELREMLWVAP